MDVMAVYRQASALVARARAGAGPGFMVCETYRFQGHGMSDPDRPYRTREEEREWQKRDPVERFASLLTENAHCTREELEAIGGRGARGDRCGRGLCAGRALPGRERSAHACLRRMTPARSAGDGKQAASWLLQGDNRERMDLCLKN